MKQTKEGRLLHLELMSGIFTSLYTFWTDAPTSRDTVKPTAKTKIPFIKWEVIGDLVEANLSQFLITPKIEQPVRKQLVMPYVEKISADHAHRS